MKVAYILLPFLVSGGLYAQSDRQAIQQWQSLHPHTLLVSSERFHQLSDQELQLLGEDYVLFEGSVSLDQLQQYDAIAASTSASDRPIAKKEDNFYVKLWLADHSDVMIIQQSVFQAMDEAKQQECFNNPTILVLQGEILTLTDLYNYEH
jgi:hypothetical protein